MKIEEFQYEKFCDSLYAQTVSAIDYWLKKILERIDFHNTILIITSDHGERIPFNEKSSFNFEPEFNSATSLGRRILPKSTHNVSGKLWVN